MEADNMKQTQRYLTQGAQAVAQTFDVFPIFQIANKLHDASYFLSLKAKNGKTIITDGNENVLATLPNPVPEAMYCIRDDYDEYFVTTLLLTYEY